VDVNQMRRVLRFWFGSEEGRERSALAPLRRRAQGWASKRLKETGKFFNQAGRIKDLFNRGTSYKHKSIAKRAKNKMNSSFII
jgi:hypothetical protein